MSLSHRVLSRGAHDCSICFKRGERGTFMRCSFYGLTTKDFCSGCVDQWVGARLGQLGGLACPGCYTNLEDHHNVLRAVLSSETYTAHCEKLTREVLNADRNVVWCPCGTAFETECGRNATPHWHRCQGCKNYVCLGCGDHSKAKTKAAKAARDKHKKRKRCDDDSMDKGMRCPQCGTDIKRTFGCSNMHCTRCNNSFSYEEKQTVVE